MLFAAVLASASLAACGGSSSVGASTGGGASSGASSATVSGGAASSTADSAGAKVFASAGCAGCHTLAAAGAHGQSGPDLDQLQPSEAAVATQVTNGGGSMPAYKNSLTAVQIKAVATYVSDVAGQ